VPLGPVIPLRIASDMAMSHSQLHEFWITAGPCPKTFGVPQRRFLNSSRAYFCQNKHILALSRGIANSMG
jgi:hypothetical protein